MEVDQGEVWWPRPVWWKMAWSQKVDQGTRVGLAAQEARVGPNTTRAEQKTTTAEKTEAKIPTAKQITTTVRQMGPKIPTVEMTELKSTAVEPTRQMTSREFGSGHHCLESN